MSVAKLYRRGRIDVCSKRDELAAAAMTFAGTIVAKSRITVRKAKMACNLVPAMSYQDAYRFEQAMKVELSPAKDFAEVQWTRLEKRPPVFKGR